MSRISVSSSRGKPSSERKWRSWPWSLSCSGRLASIGVIARGLLKGGSGGEVLALEGERCGSGQFYPFMGSQRQGSAQYIRTDRQFAGIQVEQADQADCLLYTSDAADDTINV